VFGRRVARDIAGVTRTSVDTSPPTPPSAVATAEPAGVRARLRQLMWTHVGLLRTREGLEHALDQIAALREQAPHAGSELHNLLTIAPLVATAALARNESRGSHVRLDHPRLDPAWESRQLRRLVTP
jgi:aspartate oxidase